MLVNPNAFVVNAVVKIFGPVKDNCAAFKGIWIIRVFQITLAEFVTDHAGFHNCAVKQIALKVQETGVFQHWFGDRFDHVTIFTA